MTRIRAKCPTCGDVEFGINDIVIVGDTLSTAHAYRFWCPTCEATVSRHAVTDVIELLVSAGVQLAPWADTALDGTPKNPITDRDIENFRTLLTSPDWFSHLQSTMGKPSDD